MSMADLAQRQESIAASLPTDWKSLVFTIILFGVLALLAGLLIHQSRLPQTRSRIDLDDLLLDHRTNRLDAEKVFRAGAFVVSSWVVIFMTAKLSLTEWAFAAYMVAWTYRDLAVAIKGKLAHPTPAEQPPPEKE